MQYEILRGDCIAQMRALPDASFDSIVTDPPYELGFMGKSWDASGIAYSVAMWREALRVLKPGGHLLAFSGSRTYHRMTCAIEDAGFEVRDQIMWVYGSGFPKSMDVSKAIDKAAGAVREVVGVRDSFRPNANAARDPEGFQDRSDGTITAPATDAARQWEGWGTALKPSHEPICVARKPLAKGHTVAASVLAHGTGAINIGGCRVATSDKYSYPNGAGGNSFTVAGGIDGTRTDPVESNPLGRWPANLIHDGSAARFFYCAKASKSDRGPNNTHPTVKPLALMQYLCRLVTPPGGRILDPFAGSGSTIVAALREGFTATGIELLDDHADIIEGRLDEELYGDLI